MSGTKEHYMHVRPNSNLAPSVVHLQRMRLPQRAASRQRWGGCRLRTLKSQVVRVTKSYSLAFFAASTFDGASAVATA